ncbi:hypothetical protein N7G274_009628 [Stereocaulon virgatum]|uniref:CCAAT-binding factor domain-containing protein n=1 Tax=Stereocaulon virgatum TaxID=373712 RepID=A0ABR3ZY51_9LECA
MPEIVNGLKPGKKRKRKDEEPEIRKKSRRAPKAQERHLQEDILGLEQKILESRTNYNSIHNLLDYVRVEISADEKDVLAAVALCRVFCRLMAAGNLNKPQDKASNEVTIVQWLKGKLQEYEDELLRLLENEDTGRQSTALTLLMRLVKEEATHLDKSDEAVWRDGLFQRLLRTMVKDGVAEDTRKDLIEKYVEEYDDIRYYTFARLADISSKDASETVLQNTLSILAAIESIPGSGEDLQDFYISPHSKAKHDLYSLTAHKRQAQKAWMALLRQPHTKAQRKSILDLTSHRIAPWFLKPELLLDFLTDSFNMGGSTSLMALSGLFYLIQHKNLDYPQFYPKLYSLLDSQILHSKHRSRFFRLLDTFLASTHLPAALVASFIKRLSRLTLHAPPSGIVVVVPWIYNLLKNHPSCTFMIHRNSELDKEEDEGSLLRYGDPFRMDEMDPMETDAIDSSLWEIQMLQTHYHPNVATIAKIISEQFTKQAYNLEDFLDHSYGTMLDAELKKDVKKAPEIEHEIPKRIFLKHDKGSGKEDSLLVKLWNFG